MVPAAAHTFSWQRISTSVFTEPAPQGAGAVDAEDARYLSLGDPVSVSGDGDSPSLIGRARQAFARGVERLCGAAKFPRHSASRSTIFHSPKSWRCR